MLKNDLTKRIDRAIKERVFPGCVVGIVERENTERTFQPHIKSRISSYGHLTYDHDAPKTDVMTPYDIASVTKVFTALVLLRLVQEGRVDLDKAVSHYIPEFDTELKKNKVLVRHLVTYTLDLRLPSLASLKEQAPLEIIMTILEAPLQGDPGERVLYVNATAILMGLIAMNVTNTSLGKLIQEFFLEPLGLLHTTLSPLALFNKERIAPTEICPWRKKTLQGEVHDESTHILQKCFDLGAAGLFSTVPDLLTLGEVLINRGRMRGNQYFSPETIRSMCHRDGEQERVFAWCHNAHRYMGKKCSQETFGMTGFTGCSIVCDYARGVGIVLLSNRTWPTRPKNSDAINEVRRDVADIVYRCIDNRD